MFVFYLKQNKENKHSVIKHWWKNKSFIYSFLNCPKPGTIRAVIYIRVESPTGAWEQQPMTTGPWTAIVLLISQVHI